MSGLWPLKPRAKPCLPLLAELSNEFRRRLKKKNNESAGLPLASRAQQRVEATAEKKAMPPSGEPEHLPGFKLQGLGPDNGRFHEAEHRLRVCHEVQRPLDLKLISKFNTSLKCISITSCY